MLAWPMVVVTKLESSKLPTRMATSMRSLIKSTCRLVSCINSSTFGCASMKSDKMGGNKVCANKLGAEMRMRPRGSASMAVTASSAACM